jgi:hypothetical protein
MTRCCLCFAIVFALAASAVPADDKKDGPVTPKETIKLFNGKDLSGLTPWLKDNAKNEDKKVFSVQDGVIRVSGMPMGYLQTDKEYQDYHLVVEFKWGKETYGAKGVRNSGVLLNKVGPDRLWPCSIECQVAQGCVGDLIAIGGKDADGKPFPLQFTSETAIGADKHPRWKKGGEPRTFKGGQQWWGQHQEFFKEDLDARGKNDVESPLGEWTKIEVINADKKLTIKVNGTVVNEAYDVSPPAGRILLQSEGFEILFRTFELHPLKK